MSEFASFSKDHKAIFAWLSVYYRQAASTEGFLAMEPGAQWAVLRSRVLSDNPPNDKSRSDAIEGIQEAEREEVLAWLAKQLSN